MVWDIIELRRQALEVDPPVIGRKRKEPQSGKHLVIDSTKQCYQTFFLCIILCMSVKLKLSF